MHTVITLGLKGKTMNEVRDEARKLQAKVALAVCPELFEDGARKKEVERRLWYSLEDEYVGIAYIEPMVKLLETDNLLLVCLCYNHQQCRRLTFAEEMEERINCQIQHLYVVHDLRALPSILTDIYARAAASEPPK